MMRVCKKCQIEKELNEFYLKKNGKPRSSYCKICYNDEYKGNKETKRKYYLENKEYFALKNKEWREDNKENIEEYMKKWREDNKDSIKLKRKIYVEKNKELIDTLKKKWYENNKEKIKIRKKELYHINNDKIKETKRNYVNKRRSEDPIFKLTMNIRSLIKNSFKRKFTEKSKKTIEILGCSFEEFKMHLESKFDENMTFENYGSYWEIDHIIPIDSAKSEEELIKLNHYTNLQPLYWEDNLKKSNKI